MRRRGSVPALVLVLAMLAACSATPHESFTVRTNPPPSPIDTSSAVPGRTPSPRPSQATPVPIPLTQRGDTFTEAASVSVPDSGSVVLPDGRVLIVGYALGKPVAGAYNPTSDSWTSMAPPQHVQYQPVMFALHDGRVLVIEDSGTELYDPTTGTSTIGPNMKTDRQGPGAIQLRDGRILVVGGLDPGSGGRTFLSSAEIFDPATGEFTPTGSMQTPREEPSLVVLDDGRVLVMGGDQGMCGMCGEFNMLAAAEIYDPSTGHFVPTGSLNVARGFFAATLMTDGRVFVVSGITREGENSGPIEVYNPSTGSFTQGPASDIQGHESAVALPNGRVLLAGGIRTQAVDLYDASTGQLAGSRTVPFNIDTVIGLKDGRVLFPGTPSHIYWP